MLKTLTRCTVTAMMLAVANPTMAATTVYDFTGTITRTSGLAAVFGSDFVGKTFTGSFNYDPTIPTNVMSYGDRISDIAVEGGLVFKTPNDNSNIFSSGLPTFYLPPYQPVSFELGQQVINCRAAGALSANSATTMSFSYSCVNNSFDNTPVASFAGTGTYVLAGSATAVPEPATWAMMLIGFGAMGGAMRRRQRASVKFA